MESFPGAAEEETARQATFSPSSSSSSSSSSATLSATKVLKCGYLTKEGGSYKNWKKRWFVLTSRAVLYYETEDSKKPINTISLVEIVGVSLVPDRPEANLFQLGTLSRPFFICAQSEVDREEWIFAINYAIEQLGPVNAATLLADTAQKPKNKTLFTLSRGKRAESSGNGSETSSMTSSETSDSFVSDARSSMSSSNRSATAPSYMQGYLVKRGDTVKNWKRRFFILDNFSLSYFKDEDSAEPLRVLYLTECLHVGPVPESRVERPFCIEFITSSRIFYFSAETEESKNSWLAAIMRAQQSSGKASRALSMSIDSSKAPPISDSESHEDEEETSSNNDAKERRMVPNSSIKEGFLMKQGGNIKTWKNRWFVCSGSSLSYFTDEKSNTPIKVLDLNQCTAVVEAAAGSEQGAFGFQLVFPSRTYLIQAPTRTDRAEWISTLQSVLQSL